MFYKYFDEIEFLRSNLFFKIGTKMIFNHARIFLLFFFLIFNNISYAKIYFDDPDMYSLNRAYASLNRDDLVNIKEPDRIKKMILSGILYINGDDEFKINKDCNEGYKRLKAAWDSKGIDAGYNLFLMYYNGICVDKNYDMAKFYLEATAKSGYIIAQRDLGKAYWGYKIDDLYPKNMDKAISWLTKAAENGDRRSAGYLSDIYRKGDGVDKDQVKSFKWLYEYANSNKFYDGQIIGFKELAGHYEDGVGTKKDLIKAYLYYTLSGSAGSEGKHRVAKEMTEDQIRKGRELAKEWMKKHNTYVPNY